MDARKYLHDFLMGLSAERQVAFPIAKTSFAASLYGKPWVDTVSYAECARALADCGVIPSVIVGKKEYFPSGHPLAFSPVGDLRREHWEMISDAIAIRGNLDLALLRNGSAEQIRGAAAGLLENFSKKRILLSGCCDTLYGTPAANISALRIGDGI